MNGLAAMVYEPLYHAREIANIKQDLATLLDCFYINKTIIPLALVEYEMIIANSVPVIIGVGKKKKNARWKFNKLS